MKVLLNKTENHMKYYTIELDAIEMNDFMDKAYQKITKIKNIPEYYNVSATVISIENQCNRNNIIEGALKEVLPIFCSKVIKEQKIETNMQPLIKTIQLDPLIFEMVVPLKPIVDCCGYQNIKLEPESLDIKKEEIDFVLNGLQNQFASYNIVNHEVKKGDVISIDLECNTSESTVINQKNIQLQVSKEYMSDIPGLYDEIIGIQKNELKEFKLNLPKNYDIKTIAGKEVTFRVRVNYIREKILPEINNDLANKIAPGIGTLDKLRDRIEKNIKKERVENEKSRYECRLMDKLINMSHIEYPSVMLDMEIEGLINQYKEELKSSSQDDEEYNEKLLKLSEIKLKENLRPMAEQRILWSLLINEIAKKENINISEKEIDEEIEIMSVQIGDSKDIQIELLNDYHNRQNVYELVKAKKTLKRLTDIVKANKDIKVTKA